MGSLSAFKVFTSLPTVIAPSVVGALCNEVSILSAAVLSAAIGTIALFWIACVLEDPSKHNARNAIENQKGVENGSEDRENIKPIRMHTLDEQLIAADEESTVNMDKVDGI